MQTYEQVDNYMPVWSRERTWRAGEVLQKHKRLFGKSYDENR